MQAESTDQSVKELEKSNIVHAKFDDITEHYIFEAKPIGKGGFGEVYKCRHIQTNELRAVKHIKLKSNLKTIDNRGKNEERWGTCLCFECGAFKGGIWSYFTYNGYFGGLHVCKVESAYILSIRLHRSCVCNVNKSVFILSIE